jgi:hypothetical protein
MQVTLQDPHLQEEIQINNSIAHMLRTWIKKARTLKYKKWLKGAYNKTKIENMKTNTSELTCTGTFTGPGHHHCTKRKFTQTNFRLAYL